MATQLGLYNGALVEIGAARLATLADATKARYELDAVYADVVSDCLEAGQWGFALRSVSLDADTGITPEFGFRYVFAKPDDWVRTVQISGDELFAIPLNPYDDNVGFFSATVTPVYLQYVSDGVDYGLDIANWPRSFARFVEVALAERVVTAISQNQGDKDRLQRLTLPKAKRDALNKDAMNRPTKFAPQGAWNNARGGTTRLNGTRRGL